VGEESGAKAPRLDGGVSVAANGIVREALSDLDARLDHWRETLVVGAGGAIGFGQLRRARASAARRRARLTGTS